MVCIGLKVNKQVKNKKIILFDYKKGVFDFNVYCFTQAHAAAAPLNGL